MATPRLEHAETEVEVDVEPEWQSVQSVPSLQSGNQPPSSQTPLLLLSHELPLLRQPDVEFDDVGGGGEELGWQSVQSVPVSQTANKPPSSHIPSKLYSHEFSLLSRQAEPDVDVDVVSVDGSLVDGSLVERSPQSAQSVPKGHSEKSAPGPPSSQSPSEL